MSLGEEGHNGRTLLAGVLADLGGHPLPVALGPQAGTCWGITGLIFISPVTLCSGVDLRSRSFLVPKTDSPFVPSLCFILSSVLTLRQPHLTITIVHFTHSVVKSLRKDPVSISASPERSTTSVIERRQINKFGSRESC